MLSAAQRESPSARSCARTPPRPNALRASGARSSPLAGSPLGTSDRPSPGPPPDTRRPPRYSATYLTDPAALARASLPFDRVGLDLLMRYSSALFDMIECVLVYLS